MSLSYFQDPRYQSERRLLFVILPSILLVGGGLVAGLLWAFSFLERFAQPEEARTGSSPIPKPIVENGVGEPEVTLNDVRRALDEGDWATAEALLEKVSPSRVRLADLAEVRGRIQAAAGSPGAAREEYARGLREDPSARLHYWQAVLDRDAGDLSSALSHCDRALVLEGNDALASNERFLLLLQISKKEEVKEEILSLVRVGRPKTQWLVGLAGVALEEGLMEEAATLLSHARATMNRADYFQLLTNPLIARHQTHPTLLPLFLRNSEVVDSFRN